MSNRPSRRAEDSWQPATSRPGELYTVEGQIRSWGAFARGLRNRDPRLRKYRATMMRGFFLAVGIAVCLIVAVVLIGLI
jgi:hypothetical protein